MHDTSMDFVDSPNHTQFVSQLGYDPLDDFLLIPQFMTSNEHEWVLKACAQKLRRLGGRVYSEGHFDQVIRGYKECSVSSWNNRNAKNGEI